MKNVIQTGYFARATEKGHKAAYTKTHLILDGKPMCGYKPHKTMQFVWNAQGAHKPYVECNKCKEKYDVYYIIKENLIGEFYAIFESPVLKRIILDYQRAFETEKEASDFAKKCINAFKKYTTDTPFKMKNDDKKEGGFVYNENEINIGDKITVSGIERTIKNIISSEKRLEIIF